MAVKDKRMAQVGMWTGLAGVAISVLALTLSVVAAFDPFGWREGKLVRPDGTPLNQNGFGNGEAPYQPLGRDKPTPVSIQNSRDHRLIVQQVDFLVHETKPTPERQDLTGAIKALPISFTQKHFDGSARFSMQLRKPHPVDGHDWLHLEISITAHEWRGKTFVGSVTVRYNNGKTFEIDGVEVDTQLPF